ncbi:PTS galactitol transporter subunit IIB [Lentibacillus lipolyticus]|nr:PTS galactitol transporter subunit IIB [Lentibacillus lipolyticus]
MKKVLVICGAGVATSTAVIEKLKSRLKDRNLLDEVELHQGKVIDSDHNWENYDIIVSTTYVPEHVQVDVVDGVPLLTGMGEEDVLEQVEERLQEQFS